MQCAPSCPIQARLETSTQQLAAQQTELSHASAALEEAFRHRQYAEELTAELEVYKLRLDSAQQQVALAQSKADTEQMGLQLAAAELQAALHKQRELEEELSKQQVGSPHLTVLHLHCNSPFLIALVKGPA